VRLRAEGLVKSYGRRRVVDGVSLEVQEREVVGLLGPNGAGKTTTFYMIVGFIRPEEGRIFLDDEDLTSLPMHLRARKGIGYLPQEPSIFRKLTVRENLLAILEILKPDKMEEEYEKLVEEFGLERIQDTPGYKLSGGERRRVEIARALIPEPKFLLLDEPFTGIDPLMRQEIQGIIKRLKEKGIGVLVTDHNVRETLQITDRAYLIYDGKIVLSGDAEKLIKDPVARKVYLGEEFRL